MKKQLTTDAEIWQALLAGKTVLETTEDGTETDMILVNGNACYRGDPYLEADITRLVRDYYEVTE